MKTYLGALTLLALIGCQTTSSSQEAANLPPTVKVHGTQYLYVNTNHRPLSPNKVFAPIQKAMEDQQWDAVKALAQQHLGRFPGNSDAFLFLALAHAATGDKNRARFFAGVVLKAEPGNAYAMNLLGVLGRTDAVLPEDYRRALVYFQLARQAAPQSPTPILNAASLNLEIGNFSEARSDFREAREKCLDCVASLLGSALSSQALGYYDEARQSIESVLAVDKTNETARLLEAAQLYYVNQEQDKGKALVAELLSGADQDSEIQKEARSMMNRIEAAAH